MPTCHFPSAHSGGGIAWYFAADGQILARLSAYSAGDGLDAAMKALSERLADSGVASASEIQAAWEAAQVNLAGVLAGDPEE